jgi:hypothetical protein
MSREPTSFLAFVASFRSHWFAAMSGAFSVPFVIFGALTDNKYTKVTLLALAFCGAWYAAYTIWAAERTKIVARDQRRQTLLDDISALRERVGAMRIEMERDYHAKTFNEADWEKRFDVLQDAIASKIEQFSSKAEAIAYRHRGNIQRPLNTNMGGFLNHRLVDICVHDLDYLRTFIHDYSRNRDRQL